MAWLGTWSLATLFVFGAVPPGVAQPASPSQSGFLEKALLEKLVRDVRAVEGKLDGVLGVAVIDGTSQEVLVDTRARESFPQASAIKLALLYELYMQAGAGSVRLNELVSLPPVASRALGSGILPLLSPDAKLTIRDLAVLMMSLSDNAATNVLVDRVTLAKINARMDAAGLKNTRFRRRMIDLAAAQRGEENVSTPLEMAQLAALLHRGDGLSADLATDMVRVASVPKDNPLRDALPPSVRGVDKPGALEGVRTAAGYVALPRRPYALSVCTTALKNDDDGDPAIREISRLVYETFDRLDRMEPTGRLIRSR